MRKKKPQPPPSMGDRLKAARLQASLTRGQLAKELGISSTYVLMLESNQSRPTLFLAKRWAAACSKTITEMFAHK